MENSWRIIHKLGETIKISLGKYDLVAKIVTVHLFSVFQPFLGVKSHLFSWQKPSLAIVLLGSNMLKLSKHHLLGGLEHDFYFP
jgi:hypothetical protein